MTRSEHTIAEQHRLVAILRGITPQDVPAIVGGLLDAGFCAIEVPLNSPDAFRSIEIAVRLAEHHAATGCLVGAGTVLRADEVRTVQSCGGNLIVAPNIDAAVVAQATALGMVCMPGVFTATEAHLAVASGASGLKFFPAFKLGGDGIAAIRATLPAGVPAYAVGGVAAGDFGAYLKQGIFGFGLGTSLYRPGDNAAQVTAAARDARKALAACLAAS